jgi:hypothetical protein
MNRDGLGDNDLERFAAPATDRLSAQSTFVDTIHSATRLASQLYRITHSSLPLDTSRLPRVSGPWLAEG